MIEPEDVDLLVKLTRAGTLVWRLMPSGDAVAEDINFRWANNAANRIRLAGEKGAKRTDRRK